MVSGDQEWRKEGSELSQEVARTSLHLGPQPAQERMPPRERPMWRNTRRCQTLRPRSAEGSKILGKRNSMQRQESDRPSLRRVSRKINLDVGTSILSIEKFSCIIKVFPFHVELFFNVSRQCGPRSPTEIFLLVATDWEFQEFLHILRYVDLFISILIDQVYDYCLSVRV